MGAIEILKVSRHELLFMPIDPVILWATSACIRQLRRTLGIFTLHVANTVLVGRVPQPRGMTRLTSIDLCFDCLFHERAADLGRTWVGLEVDLEETTDG